MSDLARYLVVALVSATWAVGLRTLWLSLPRKGTFRSPYHVYLVSAAYLVMCGTIAGVSAFRIGSDTPVNWWVTVSFVVALVMGLSALFELYIKMKEKA